MQPSDPSKILIVDDELSIRIMLTRMIEPLQHEVYVAADGEAALEIVRKVGIDLVVSDLMMPRMDGLTLLEHVRAEGFDSAYIILTGFGDLPQALAARERFNISNFLVKPIHNMDQFLFDVQSALSRRVLEQENQRLMWRMQDINAQLEEKVRARTVELEQKNRELDRLSTYRADALKVLGHELRTPLAILSGYHALATQASHEEFASVAPAMGDSIARLRQIVDKALQWLKATGTSGFPLELEDVVSTQICAAVVRRIAPFIAHRRIQIQVPPICASARLSRWDRGKMEEVIEELLINAIRASADGSRIDMDVEPEDDTVSLLVRDYGVGVPAESLEQIFEPFFTLCKATNHTSGMFELGAEGVGIGLSTARMWVELHGGSITATPNGSHPGMTFRVRMPRIVQSPSGARDGSVLPGPGGDSGGPHTFA